MARSWVQLWSHFLKFQLLTWFSLLPPIHTSRNTNNYWTANLFLVSEIRNRCLLDSCLFPHLARFRPGLPHLDLALLWTRPTMGFLLTEKYVGSLVPLLFHSSQNGSRALYSRARTLAACSMTSQIQHTSVTKSQGPRISHVEFNCGSFITKLPWLSFLTYQNQSGNIHLTDYSATASAWTEIPEAHPQSWEVAGFKFKARFVRLQICALFELIMLPLFKIIFIFFLKKTKIISFF